MPLCLPVLRDNFHPVGALSPFDVRADSKVVSVNAPGRLHLGFLDPSGTLGRRFGSLGLMIEGFETELHMRFAGADALAADGPAAEAELKRTASCLALLRRHTGLHAPLALRLLRVLPAHAGFGSGTQLALALGRGFACLHGLELPTAQLALWLGRGQRSGIGIAGFDVGGLLVDGGPSADGVPAPLLARVAMPAAWRVVVVLDTRLEGLSGVHERQAIARLAPFAQTQAADICHRVLMQVLPGAATADFAAFAAGINRVQDLLGEHFAPAQGGSAWTSPAVGQLMRWMRGASGTTGGAGPIDMAAIGQSSWGPTGFAIFPSAAAAQQQVDAARCAGMVDAALELRVVGCRNRGAAISGNTSS